MGIILRLRGTDGKFVKGDVSNLEEHIVKFASNVIQDGRKILNTPGSDGYTKRTRGDTLFSQYHYTMKTGTSTISLGFDFGDANDYWQFVDQGVQGTGDFGDGETKKSEKNKRKATLVPRGMGSPFRFKYNNPGGVFFYAIKNWIANKPVSLLDISQDSLAWAIGYTVKRRGLDRTLFYTKPVEKHLKKLPDELVQAFKLDVEKLIGKLPKEMVIGIEK